MERATPGGIVSPPLAVSWWATPFFGFPLGTAGRNNYGIVAIVDHIAQGWRAGMRAVLASGQVSWHYSVYRDGTIEQHIKDEDASWGAGLVFSAGYGAYRSDISIPWIQDCWDRWLNPNKIVINIEHEGMSGAAFTPEQTAATVALHRELSRRHGIPLTAEYVVGHSALDAVSRGQDPGPTFPWAEVLA